MGSLTRRHYKVFSEAKIGTLTVANRLVRSATWDPSILQARRMTDAVLNLYRDVAAGGIGLIITGDFSVIPKGILGQQKSPAPESIYPSVRIENFDRLVDVVHGAAPLCKIIAQLSGGYPGVSPSGVPTVLTGKKSVPLSTEQVRRIITCFIEVIEGIKKSGFDGVQLHAAHGGMLSTFLSPYTNRRCDKYGGSARDRARVISEIVAGARERVGDFPILIKMNCTDYVEGGIDMDTVPDLAAEIERADVDAIEISGGMWDCLSRTEHELGFRPVPAPESHTRIGSPDKQSYFLEYAKRLNLCIPVILVGGNRDIERLEKIIRQGSVDYVALCRPLLAEPDLPARWLEGRGGGGTQCISCNSCIYDMLVHVERGQPRVATCLVKHDRQNVKRAQEWLASWVERNRMA